MVINMSERENKKCARYFRPLISKSAMKCVLS
jgi:hypothetical protein